MARFILKATFLPVAARTLLSMLEEAWGRCQSEAKAAFGSDSVYVERLIRKARHY